MTDQPNTPNPNQPTTPNAHQPAASQPAPMGGAAQPVPGTQAPDTFVGAPVGQPPVNPQKKNTGLLIGGLIAVAIAIIIIALLFLTGVFGGSSKVSSYDKFKGGMQEATAGSAASKCLDSADTVIKSEMEDIKEEEAPNLNVNPEDIGIFMCSSVDLSNMMSMLEADDSTPLVMGIYAEGNPTIDEELSDFSEADSENGWAVYGENWAIVGMNTEESVKAKLLDEFNGTESVPSK
ncbi:MAG: hypothetical protein SPI83_02725 [Rothia sp. (in: high G+C Gram-positive bacteria)]|nr:hypothetical protein [Rothia sp. (in: high G+C Gram-positive bacteria)]